MQLSLNGGQAAAIVIATGRRLMAAYNAAPADKKSYIAGLMWDHLRVAAIIENKSLDELHRELIAELEEKQAA